MDNIIKDKKTKEKKSKRKELVNHLSEEKRKSKK